MAVIDVDYYSAVLARTVTFRAVFPYDKYAAPYVKKENVPDRYKTLYLLHGYSGNYTDWITGSGIHRYAIDRDLMVIMPSGENSFYVDNPEFDRYYSKFIGEELVEFTRKLFPISEKREDTYIAGLSMGGYGALVNGLKYSDTFSKIGVISGGLVLDRITSGSTPLGRSKGFYNMIFGDISKIKGSDKDYKALMEKLITDKKDIPGIYMAIGEQDELFEPNLDYVEFLKAYKVPVTFETAPGRHNWEFWDPYILRFLNWLFPDYKEPEWVEIV